MVELRQKDVRELLGHHVNNTALLPSATTAAAAWTFLWGKGKIVTFYSKFKNGRKLQQQHLLPKFDWIWNCLEKFASNRDGI
jgi:hypothetical protein